MTAPDHPQPQVGSTVDRDWPSRPGFLLVLATGALLWIVAAVSRSLWIDEFHSLNHAGKPDFGEFLASVATDNHPPLAFALTRWARWLLGSSEVAMRSWSVLIGLAVLLPTARLARRLPDECGRRAAPWLVVLSSYSLMIFSEARMYGLMALAVLGLMSVVIETLQGRSRGWWAVAWCAIGLHSHYYFLQYGLVLAVVLVIALPFKPEWRRGTQRLVLPAVVGLLLFVPWGLTGFREQLAHDMPSGGSSGAYSNWMGFAQSLAHFLFINASVGGRWLTYGVALPGSVAAALVGGLGLVRLWRARRADAGLTFWLLVSVALLAPAWCLIFSKYMPRAGYNWRYIAGSCVPLLLILAAGIRWRPWPRAVLSGLLFTSLAIVAGVLAFSPGQEDYRGVIGHILQHAKENDALITRPMRRVDPENAPTGWEYYTERLAADPRSAGPVPVEYRLARWKPALEHDRVWVYIRYRFDEAVLEQLSHSYAKHEVIHFPPVMKLHLFSR